MSFGMIKKDVLETDFIDRLFDKAKKYFRPIYPGFSATHNEVGIDTFSAS